MTVIWMICSGHWGGEDFGTEVYTDYLKRSFVYSGAQLWNNLPKDLGQAFSLTDFKSKLRTHTLIVRSRAWSSRCCGLTFVVILRNARRY